MLTPQPRFQSMQVQEAEPQDRGTPRFGAVAHRLPRRMKARLQLWNIAATERSHMNNTANDRLPVMLDRLMLAGLAGGIAEVAWVAPCHPADWSD